MGQKINPISLRLQNTNRYFNFCWYNTFFYTDLINQDLKIQKYLNSIFKQLQYPTSKFFIQSSQKKVKIFTFFCSPLKSRKIRSNYFKTKYYKISKNSLKVRNNGLQDFRTEGSTFDLKFSKLKNEKNLHKKKPIELNPLLNKGFGQEPLDTNRLISGQQKLVCFKYRLFSNFFQKFYCNKIKQDKFLSLLNIILDRKMEKPAKVINKKKKTVELSPVFFNIINVLNHVKFGLKKGILPSYSKGDKISYQKHIEKVLTQNLSRNVNIYSIKTNDHFRSASFLAEEIVYYLEKRIPFRRIKNRILKEVKFLPSVKGLRIACSGRVGGRSKKAQRAKTETIQYGQTSLHVFSSPIDFSSKSALTPFGLVGVKVWICYTD